MILTDNLSTLFLIYFFNYLIRNQLYADTATVVDQVVSENSQSLFVLFVALIKPYDCGVT